MFMGQKIVSTDAPSGRTRCIRLQTKELHNGRAAMMGIAGLVTHNLITGGMPAFEQISRGVYSGGIQ